MPLPLKALALTALLLLPLTAQATSPAPVDNTAVCAALDTRLIEADTAVRTASPSDTGPFLEAALATVNALYSNGCSVADTLTRIAQANPNKAGDRTGLSLTGDHDYDTVCRVQQADHTSLRARARLYDLSATARDQTIAKAYNLAADLQRELGAYGGCHWAFEPAN